MRTILLPEKRCLVIHAWLGLLCCLMMSCGIAHSNTVQNSIRIVWGSSSGEIHSFMVRPARTNHVEILLIADGKLVDKRQAESSGGIQPLLMLAEQASKEVAAKGKTATDAPSDSKRRLEITFVRGGLAQSFSLEGSIKELTQFFGTTVALKKLLQMASDEQPKMYRLIDEDGPGKAMMRPPKRQ